MKRRKCENWKQIFERDYNDSSSGDGMKIQRHKKTQKGHRDHRKGEEEEDANREKGRREADQVRKPDQTFFLCSIRRRSHWGRTHWGRIAGLLALFLCDQLFSEKIFSIKWEEEILKKTPVTSVTSEISLTVGSVGQFHLWSIPKIYIRFYKI